MKIDRKTFSYVLMELVKGPVNALEEKGFTVESIPQFAERLVSYAADRLLEEDLEGEEFLEELVDDGVISKSEEE